MICDIQQCGMCDQQSLRSACAYAQSDQSLCLSLEYFMTVKLLTEHHFEFLSLKGGVAGSSESTLLKMPHCWKSHVEAHIHRSLSRLQAQAHAILRKRDPRKQVFSRRGLYIGLRSLIITTGQYLYRILRSHFSIA